MGVGVGCVSNRYACMRPVGFQSYLCSSTRPARPAAAPRGRRRPPGPRGPPPAHVTRTRGRVGFIREGDMDIYIWVQEKSGVCVSCAYLEAPDGGGKHHLDPALHAWNWWRWRRFEYACIRPCMHGCTCTRTRRTWGRGLVAPLLVLVDEREPPGRGRLHVGPLQKQQREVRPALNR